ncbi:MAG: nucleoside-diphosphate sugar epimerase [Elusimicrobia bacterium RIFCSPLOWO2_01_FULL_54_10]|nr:MAG: nucleoside-diphosphate sugar epimerase [Elusimicrobia bacterium RIFCSPLOWO2_01_FULL_54_10]
MVQNGANDVVVVTGSSGLIGTAVIGRLAERFRIVALDREGPPHPPPTAESIATDMTSGESLKRALERLRHGYGNRIASVIHLAAYYDFSGKPSPLYDEVTVRGTERLLKGLEDFEVGQFIFSSTMLVHKPCLPGERIDETWPVMPKWDYPASKAKTEDLIIARHSKTPAVLLRIAGIYDDECHSIPIANQIRRIYERELTSLVYPGDTSTGQSFLHLDDLVDACLSLVKRRGKLPHDLALLLGEPETLSYRQMQKVLGRQIHGVDWKTFEIPKVLAKIGAWIQDNMPFAPDPFIKPWMIDLASDHYAVDIRLARSILNWEPQHSLLDTLPKMVAELKKNPAEWYQKNKLKPPSRLKSEPVGDVRTPARVG